MKSFGVYFLGILVVFVGLVLISPSPISEKDSQETDKQLALGQLKLKKKAAEIELGAARQAVKAIDDYSGLIQGKLECVDGVDLEVYADEVRTFQELSKDCNEMFGWHDSTPDFISGYDEDLQRWVLRPYARQDAIRECKYLHRLVDRLTLKIKNFKGS